MIRYPLEGIMPNGFFKRFLPILLLAATLGVCSPVEAQGLTCWFVPGADAAKCKVITDSLSKESGLQIAPRIATSYAEIFKAAAEKKDALIYAGSFASAMLLSRKLIFPLVQRIDGKEFYSGVMILPKGGDAQAVLKTHAGEISFALGASSGESSAKAATGGKASIGVRDHAAAVNAIKAGRAKAAFVKNWWWEANQGKFPEYHAVEIPGVSVRRNPDNILSVTTSVKEDVRAKVLRAALASKAAFEAQRMDRFEAKDLTFSQTIMTKGGINPLTYVW